MWRLEPCKLWWDMQHLKDPCSSILTICLARRTQDMAWPTQGCRASTASPGPAKETVINSSVCLNLHKRKCCASTHTGRTHRCAKLGSDNGDAVCSRSILCLPQQILPSAVRLISNQAINQCSVEPSCPDSSQVENYGLLHVRCWRINKTTHLVSSCDVDGFAAIADFTTADFTIDLGTQPERKPAHQTSGSLKNADERNKSDDICRRARERVETKCPSPRTAHMHARLVRES